MSTRRRHRRFAYPSLSFFLLAALLIILWAGGGAARADVAGQLVSRGASVLALLMAILFVDKPVRELGAVPLLLAAAIVLTLVQLIPLPPAVWQALPGRALFIQAIDDGRLWRPLSIEPGATVNAAASLLVPATVLVLVTAIRPGEERIVLAILLGMIGAAALYGLTQLTGTPLGNPLVNDTPGAISGPFANRNHFALFLALGCLIAPVWGAAQGGRQTGWRLPLALGAMILFFLIILASGSRAGILTGVLGAFMGMTIVWREIRHAARRMPRWMQMAVLLTILAGVIALVLLTIASDRAQSINRALAMSSGEDMRSRAWPTVIYMIGFYLPLGTGFGNFDTVFRIHEPFGLLKPTYFNHAHNDFLEIVLNGGIPALVLLAVALGWWLTASICVWRAGSTATSTMGRLGSAMLLVVVVASMFDYPSRTPLIMAVIVLASTWLDEDGRARRRAALPVGRRPL